MGHRSGRLRLGGRARQLPERPVVRETGRGPRAPVLARRATPAGQGHPAVPLRLLAGDAARGGIRRAAPALRARVSPARRPQDLEVARQRPRPSRPGRRVRRGCRAVLVRSLGVVRPGRRRGAGPAVPAAPARAAQEGVSLASRPSRAPDVGPTLAPLDRGCRRPARSSEHVVRPSCTAPTRRTRSAARSSTRANAIRARRDHAPDSGRPPAAKVADRAHAPCAGSLGRPHPRGRTPRPSWLPGHAS